MPLQTQNVTSSQDFAPKPWLHHIPIGSQEKISLKFGALYNRKIPNGILKIIQTNKNRNRIFLARNWIVFQHGLALCGLMAPVSA